MPVDRPVRETNEREGKGLPDDDRADKRRVAEAARFLEDTNDRERRLRDETRDGLRLPNDREPRNRDPRLPTEDRLAAAR